MEHFPTFDYIFFVYPTVLAAKLFFPFKDADTPKLLSVLFGIKLPTVRT